MESYPTPSEGASKDRHDPVSIKPNIRAVKDGTRIEQAATDYGEFKFFGNGRLLGRCVALDHEDRTPSMSIYTDSQKFKCYGCGAVGDVIDLVMLAEGCETGEAMVTLATRYGVELPGRSERWHKHQEDKAAIREEMRRGLTKVYQRRFFRMFRDCGAHPEDDIALWEAMYHPAYLAATERVMG